MRVVAPLRAFLLGLAVAMLALFAPLAAEAVVVTPADKLDLSNHVDWCESGPDADIEAIAAGGCRFAPATPTALSGGYSSSAYWLRFILVNPESRTVERWLQVGNPRLESVVFFEKESERGWRRTEAGSAVPAAKRPVLSPNPLLPVTLAPLESRTVLVRIASRTSINAVPILWRERAYAEAENRRDFYQALALGGRFMAALIILMIALIGRVSQWSTLANLFFGSSLLLMCVFDASITGQLPTYMPPGGWGFDVRVQGAALGGSTICFLCFLRHFVGTRLRAPRQDLLLRLLIAVLTLNVGWTLFDFSRGYRLLVLMSFVVMACVVAVLWRAWRERTPGAGYLLTAYAINYFLTIHRIVMAFTGSEYADELVLAYSCIYLLVLPLTPIGIAMHERAILRDLDAARREAASRLEFLARMSHELRTPLDSILGNAQLLARPGGKALMAEGLAIIQDSGWHLLRMIDDILDHVRGLAGKLAIVPVSVDWPAFLRALETDAARVAARNGNRFTLRCEGAPLRRVRLDEGRLRQILDNLIANAARHTAKGRIEIDCWVEPGSKDNAVSLAFTVSDTGEGVAYADQERIFLPFERGAQTVSRYGGKGMGMGLAIARQLVEMMGGRLTVESRPGEGARFRFLALAEREDSDAAAPIEIGQAARYAGPPRTLLLIDDDDGARRVLAAFLRAVGFQVIAVSSGRAALSALASTASVHLVLTDQFMADGDGWMALKAMAERLADAPVVLLSAAPSERPPQFPEGLSFAAHLMKPLDHDKVLRCIGDLIDLGPQPWTREEEAVAAAPPPPAPRPDPAAMAALAGLIDEGRISDILSWAVELSNAEPRYAGFASEVEAAASRLDFAALERLSEGLGRQAAAPRRPDQDSGDAPSDGVIAGLG